MISIHTILIGFFGCHFLHQPSQHLLPQACHRKNVDRGAAGHGHFYLLAQDIFDDSLEIELVVGVDVDRVLQAVLLVVHVQHGQGLLHRIGTYSYSSWAPSGSFSMAGVDERDTSGRDSRLVDDL